MKAREKSGQGQELEEVKQAFAEWRKERKHRTPIPRALWDAAVKLSRQYSVNHISKALHLNYTELKKRFQRPRSGKSLSNSESRRIDMPGATFVELEANQPLWSGVSVIEMVKPDGCRMRMQVQGESSYVLLELVKSFMSKGQ
jgi:hypothetical protein